MRRRLTDLTLKIQQDKGKEFGTLMNGLLMIETIKASGGESDFFYKVGRLPRKSYCKVAGTSPLEYKSQTFAESAFKSEWRVDNDDWRRLADFQ